MGQRHACAARIRRIALEALAPVACLLIYWPGLTSWFQKDDFAWLGLRLLVHNWNDLGWALFSPLAQGTIRTWSERAFFMVFSALFGLNALPYHLCVFLTQAANLLLLISVVKKLTGSRSVGIWAAILWAVNSAMSVALSWAAAYNEVLCAFFILLSLWLLVRYVETGQRRYYVAQCCTFVLGFGALELEVMYPAIAGVYAFFYARSLVRKLIPLFVVSAFYTAVHVAIAPLPTSGPYQFYWTSAFRNLWLYWKLAMGPTRLILLHIPPSLWRSAITAALTIALIGFLGYELYRKRWMSGVFAAWFVLALLPLLPLREHILDMYLTVPLIGLAAWGALALVRGWQSGVTGKVVAVVLVTIYFAVSAPLGRLIAQDIQTRSRRTRGELFGIAALARAHPGKTVLLEEVGPELFESALRHRPLRLFGIFDVAVVPDDRQRLAAYVTTGSANDFFADPAAVARLLARNRAVVYDVSGGRVEDTTSRYRARHAAWEAMLSKKVEVGEEWSADQLGPGWYQIEKHFRWMGKRASVKLRGPDSPGERLRISGFCPAAVVRSGPLAMRLTIDGQPLTTIVLDQPDAPIDLELPLPAKLLGKPRLEIVIDLDRTVSVPGDTRALGLPFGSFEIR